MRHAVEARPTAVAFAAYLGYLSGSRGVEVLDTPWAELLDLAAEATLDALRSAHSEGLIDLLVAGSVSDVSFSLFEGVSK
jgi:hypothetical protein